MPLRHDLCRGEHDFQVVNLTPVTYSSMIPGPAPAKPVMKLYCRKCGEFREVPSGS
jgi:hypothetical protein